MAKMSAENHQLLTDMIQLHGWMCRFPEMEQYNVALAKVTRRAFPTATLSFLMTQHSEKDDGQSAS